MAGFKRIKTKELNDVEKELVMAFRVTKWKYEKEARETHDMNGFWWMLGAEFNERLSQLAKSRK